MKWLCTVCEYVYEGDTPPEACPICKVPADKFVQIKEEEEVHPDDMTTLDEVSHC